MRPSPRSCGPSLLRTGRRCNGNERAGLRVPEHEADVQALRNWVRALDDAGYRLKRFSLDETDPYEQRIITASWAEQGSPTYSATHW